MLVHSVFFWLKPGLGAAEVARFERGLGSLARIATVRRCHIGKPAAMPVRAVIDASYGFALTVVFDDLAGHDEYQVDPIHARFLSECSSLWTRVQVYDSEGAEVGAPRGG